MTIEELDAFIETDQGKEWMTRHKKPLLDKRDELLKSLRESNAALATLTQRASDSERILGEERSALSKMVIDRPLTEMLSKIGVPLALQPGIIATLREDNVFKIESDGLNRSAKVVSKDSDGKDEELDLGAFVDKWHATPEGKQFMPPWANSGAPKGGSTQPTTFGRENLGAMSSEEILSHLPELTKRT